MRKPAIKSPSFHALPIVVLTLGLACHGAPGSGTQAGDPGASTPARGAELSARERQAIVAQLERRGVPAADLTFHQRRVFVQGDAFLYADDVLGWASRGSLDKGRVPTRVALDASGFPDCSVAACGGVSPAQYARAAQPGELAFRRPDTTRTYFLVIADTAPSYFTEAPADAGTPVPGGILGAAAAAIVEASPSDCLESSLFRVLRESEYDGLPGAVREAGYAVRITTGQFFEVCSRAAVACANLPRLEGESVDAGPNPRLRFGDHVAFVDTALVTPTSALVELDAYAIGVATHELLHTLGVGHPQPSSLGEQVVPGTASGQDHDSIMQASSSSPTWHPTLQADDRALLAQLYSPPCGYSAEFRIISAGSADAGFAAEASRSTVLEAGIDPLGTD